MFSLRFFVNETAFGQFFSPSVSNQKHFYSWIVWIQWMHSIFWLWLVTLVIGLLDFYLISRRWSACDKRVVTFGKYTFEFEHRKNRSSSWSQSWRLRGKNWQNKMTIINVHHDIICWLRFGISGYRVALRSNSIMTRINFQVWFLFRF